MRTKLKFLLLLAAAAAGLGQSEDEPYFALSSSRTFASGDRASVSMSAWKVDALEFRVYRVNDPEQFFRQLEDPHQFGTETPRPPRERTLLERVHLWKRSLRAGIRRELRAQFTESPRAHLPVLNTVASMVPVPAAKGTKYAEAPLLNSQQMVLSFVQPVAGKTRWDRQDVPLDVKDKGVYLVEAVKGELRAYTILMVSDLVLITKSGSSRILNAAVDRKTGQPVANVRVAAFVRDGAEAESVTDTNGIAEMKPVGAEGSELRIVARNGRDYAVNTMPGGGIRDSSLWMGYIFTDRPVYRPGHTVHFKGVLRVRRASGFEVPAGKNVTVEIQDPDGKPVYQKTLTANANGSIRDDLTLQAGAALGHYFIEVKAGEAFMSGNFEVEEYKKPEYEVRVAFAQPHVLEGAKATALVDARYFFGEPVSGAKVKYAVYRERYWFPMWYDPGEDMGEQEGGMEDDAGDQMEEQDGVLDADGKMTVQVETAVSDHKFDYRYRLEARVTDAGNREITGRGSLIATYGSFALNVAPERYVYGAGAKAAAKIEARNYDNQPVRTRAHVELLKWNNRQPEKSEVKAAVDVETGPEGTGTARFDIPAESGSYMIRATARGPEGRDIEGSSHVWVAGGGQWDDRLSDRSVQILSDQKTYRAGETAKLVIVTGQDNTPVYVGVEGRDLRQYSLMRSKGPTVTFDVPVAANDEPGITVTAAFVRDGVFHNGDKYLRIPPLEHQLNVKLTTDKPQYQPGQEAGYTIEATSADGKPAPRAEFSLGVVDEAIYGIRRDTTRDILKFFFDRDWNRVFTDNSLDYYFTGEAGKRRMRLAELRPASRLAQLKPERQVQPKVRKAFPDTAFWAADLVTDSAGRARARVELPDSLTTWRATARGITPDTKAGGATLKTIVRKNVILRLVVPRFFVQGDEVVISALVHNYLQDAKTARVSLEVEGLEVLDGAARDVPVASRGEAKVDWRVRAKAVRSAKLTGKALTDEESDALELELPVNLPGLKMAEARGGSVAAGGTADFEMTYPANIVPGSRELSVRVSPSIAGALFGALDYLITFPYGCVEQTMSSFLPNVVVKQAVQELGLKVQMDEAGLQEKIRAGLERLYAFQHEDGGWGWWQSDGSHPFMTAYVVAGLAQAQQSGVRVNAEAVEKGLAWVKKDFAADPRLAADLRAYMVYSMAVAGAPDPAATGQVYERRSSLSPYGMAILGLALQQVKDGRAADVASALEASAQQDAEQAWWPATRDQMLDFSEDVTPEATAFAAKFLSRQKPGSALLPKAALWLMNHRNEGYWWSSTKQTAMVIYGLTDYLKTTNELKPKFTATVLVNDRPVWTQKIDQTSMLNLPPIVLEEGRQQPGTNRVRITTSGEGRLYYSARAEYHSRDEKLQKSGTVALNLLRDYFRMVPGKDGDKIVYDTVPLNGPVAAGDIIAVRLTVTGSEWKYVMLEDPIPAGTEFIERDNVYELRNRPPWWEYQFTRREMHDDRMAIFQTYMAAGQQQYFYLLKVVNPGAFQVNPARVGPMYQNDVMATSESRRLEVK